MRRLVPLLVPLAALAPAGALADGTWDLRCPSMPREQRPPAAVWPAVHAFWPWGPRAFEPGLHAGPVWLLAGSYRTSISRDGDETDSQGYYLHRALVAVAPSSTGAVVLRGHRLG